MQKCIHNSKEMIISKMLPIFTFQAALCALVILEAHGDVTTINGNACDYVIFDPGFAQLEHRSQIRWYKGDVLLKQGTHGSTGYGQQIRVFHNGTLGLRVVGKEDAGQYTAKVCASSQHCLHQRTFQLHVHGYLIRGIVGDCVAFHLACLQSAGYIHAIWKKDRQRVAQIRRQSVNASEVYCKRARVFHNGSLSLCPAEWRDQGEYVAEVYDQDGLHLHQIFHLELKKVETLQEITEFIGGSIFLNLTEMMPEHFFQIAWKKENTEVARTNGSWFWYHGEYGNRSEIVSSHSLRLDRIETSDRGRYSIEVKDRDGRVVYEGITNVNVEQKEVLGRNPSLYVLIISAAVVVTIFLVALIWDFQKPGHRTGVPVLRHSSLRLTDDGDYPEQHDWSENAEEKPKLPELKGRKAAEPPASVSEVCVVPNVENNIHPAFEDCIPSNFDYPAPPVFDSAPAEFEEFLPPGFEDLNDKEGVVMDNAYHASSRCKVSWKCSEGGEPSTYALIKTECAEDKSGDSEWSSYYQTCQETC
ncbi:uncharacterized protein [Anser cygnoides]|uniref:uncharacterized protein isoform X1 n=1 Tax=Anser cygnoides TaxID=8845 RepID=UPI0034D33DC8